MEFGLECAIELATHADFHRFSDDDVVGQLPALIDDLLGLDDRFLRMLVLD